MLELFSKLFQHLADHTAAAFVFRMIHQRVIEKNYFVHVAWRIGFQANHTKREPRAEIGGCGCTKGARPVIRADYLLIPIQNLNVKTGPYAYSRMRYVEGQLYLCRRSSQGSAAQVMHVTLVITGWLLNV